MEIMWRTQIMFALYMKIPSCLHFRPVIQKRPKDLQYYMNMCGSHFSTYPELNSHIQHKKKRKHKKRFKPYEELLKVLEVYKKYLQEGKLVLHSSTSSKSSLMLDADAFQPIYRTSYFSSINNNFCNASHLNNVAEQLKYDSDIAYNYESLEICKSCESWEDENFSKHFEIKFDDLEKKSADVEFLALSSVANEPVLSNTSVKKNKKKHKSKKEQNSITAKLKEDSIKKSKSEKLKKNFAKDANLEKYIKSGYYIHGLKEYIKVCINANMIIRSHVAFLHYRYKSKVSSKLFPLKDVSVYNALLQGWAKKGNLERVQEIFSYMDKDDVVPNLQSFAAYLECLSRSKKMNTSEIQKIADSLKHVEKDFEDIFRDCIFVDDQREKILEVIKTFAPSVVYSYEKSSEPYICPLLEKLNNKEYQRSSSCSYINNCIKHENVTEMISSQLDLEKSFFIRVKSVANENSNVSDHVKYLRKCVKEIEGKFKDDLSVALRKNMKNLWNKIKSHKNMSLYPYLKVIDLDFLTHILLQEIRFLAETSEFFSPNLKILYRSLGVKVMNQYFIWLRKENKVSDKVFLIYQRYMDYLLTPEFATKYLPREYWEMLKAKYCAGPTIDVTYPCWPQNVLYEIGRFLYSNLIHHATFNSNVLHLRSKRRNMTPAFYTTYVSSGVKLSEQIRAHPSLCKLYRDAQLEELEFDVTLVPMLVPPRPWIRVDAGGYLITSTLFIRLPNHAYHHNSVLENVPVSQLFPCFDSLNSLSLCPWIINKPMLDLIIVIFRNNGSEELDIPLNPIVCNTLPKISASMTKEEKYLAMKEKSLLKKKKAEITSLWYDCLYKLSIANHFRDKMFWFPHNLDFRGRVYPVPPHFNHLGNDMIRSILLFAEGRPLGKNGLDWLKIHLINLTGFKKRDPHAERLRYANEMIPEVLDSANKPFMGNQWWKTSEKPWQTLACCKEIAAALRSPCPEKYISHFPVHQDGSCNGLQHYAALGRDELGAKEVNLSPSPSPQDVYSGVAALVEKERRKDAAEGVRIAQILDGIVKRKVIKQTVMTYVYGVTRYGARLQILKQLKDIPEFPEEYCHKASVYLMKKTFLSIEKMFTATKEIQKWFTECAQLITKVTGEPVEWITPLGLPVIQPYHQKAIIRSSSDFLSQQKNFNSYSSTFENFQLPNILKQKNAFAPNFIHSLDSSHMMLTTLFCHRRGITFVSVHDCFWTHAASVEIMNEVCRQQFVSLHKQPILENLSNFFLQKYGKFNFIEFQNENEKEQYIKLESVLAHIPEKGTFDLEKVLESEYFFS